MGVIDWLDKVDLRKLAFSAIIIVFLFGLFFYSISHSDPASGLTEELPSFSDALYFSLVTFSSLGYGDVAPLGHSRLLASIEVIIGLIFIGLFVSRMASWRHEKILDRMYQREYVNHIREIIDNIATHRQSLVDLTQAFEKDAKNKDLQREIKTHFATKETGYLQGISSFMKRSKGFLARQVMNDPDSVRSVDTYYWERLMHSLSITLREVQSSLERLRDNRYKIRKRVLQSHVMSIGKHSLALGSWIVGQAATQENKDTLAAMKQRIKKMKSMVRPS